MIFCFVFNFFFFFIKHKTGIDLYGARAERESLPMYCARKKDNREARSQNREEPRQLPCEKLNERNVARGMKTYTVGVYI